MYLCLDVTAPSLPDTLQHALAIYGHVDILVNNAAYSLLGAVESISDQEVRAQMDTNFFAPVRVVKALLPSMRARRSGTTVAVSSIAGQVALPGVSMYAASKHALEGSSPPRRTLSESLSRAPLTPAHAQHSPNRWRTKSRPWASAC
jgi:NAD(P)-dependent dehydrogenase (short-subunit alcohol dehydrogenase family)